MDRAEDARELLDGPVPRADLAACLDDLHRLNRWFGGYALTLARLRRAAARLPPAGVLVVVDVGGGRGDFARHAVRWARRRRRPIRVVVVDRDTASLALAREACAGYPEIGLVQGDAAHLPLGEGTADVVASSLTLHHLPPDTAAASLAAMAAVARGVVVVNDLVRARLSLALVWLTTRALRLHPMSRHDGPLSVRRAYTVQEARVLAEKAGFARVTVTRYPWVGRLVLEGR